MEMATLHQVLILFLMAAAGYLMARKKIWNDQSILTLTSLVVNIANPCLNYSKLEQLEHGTVQLDWLQAFCFSLIFLGLALGVCFLIYRKCPHDERAVYVQLCVLSNCGFMGYPMIEAALGPQAIGYGVAFVTAFNIISWSVALALFYRDIKMGLRKMVNPVMVAVALGLTMQLLGLRLPAVLSDTVAALGGVATPLAMLIAGAYFAQLRPALLKNGRFLAACAVRLLLFPVLALGAMRLLGLTGDLARAIFITCAMPAASNTVMQASAYSTPRARELAVGGVALTTALSVATIPLVMLLL